MTPGHDPNTSALEAITESVTLRFISRAAMVATPLVISAFIFVGLEAWRGQQEANRELVSAVRGLSDRVLRIETRTQVLEEIRSNKIPRGSYPPTEFVE
jgi:hypothetical protein